MSAPAFRRIDDELRTFLGRTCQVLLPMEPDLLSRARPPKSTRQFRSTNELELQHWFWVLINSCALDKTSGKSSLCGQVDVPRDFFGDLHYCKGLRDRYAHLAGVGRPVPTLQQLSDLIIVRRVVRALADVAPDGDPLSKRLDTLIDELTADAAALSSPEQFDRDDRGLGLSASDKSALADSIAARLQCVRYADHVPDNPIPNWYNGLLVQLNEIRAIVSRTDHIAMLGELRRSVDNLLQSFDRERERSFASESLERPSEVGESDPAAASDEEVIDDADLAETFSELVARLRAVGGSSVSSLGPLSLEEARDELIQLRRRIWRETRSGPSSDGLLRKSMIDAFLRWCPRNQQELDGSSMSGMMATIAYDQLPFLEEVFGVLRRVGEDA